MQYGVLMYRPGSKNGDIITVEADSPEEAEAVALDGYPAGWTAKVEVEQ